MCKVSNVLLIVESVKEILKVRPFLILFQFQTCSFDLEGKTLKQVVTLKSLGTPKMTLWTRLVCMYPFWAHPALSQERHLAMLKFEKMDPSAIKRDIRIQNRNVQPFTEPNLRHMIKTIQGYLKSKITDFPSLRTNIYPGVCLILRSWLRL